MEEKFVVGLLLKGHVPVTTWVKMYSPIKLSKHLDYGHRIDIIVYRSYS